MSDSSGVEPPTIIRSHEIADFKVTLQNNVLCKKADDKIKQEYEKIGRSIRVNHCIPTTRSMIMHTRICVNERNQS